MPHPPPPTPPPCSNTAPSPSALASVWSWNWLASLSTRGYTKIGAPISLHFNVLKALLQSLSNWTQHLFGIMEWRCHIRKVLNESAIVRCQPQELAYFCCIFGNWPLFHSFDFLPVWSYTWSCKKMTQICDLWCTNHTFLVSQRQPGFSQSQKYLIQVLCVHFIICWVYEDIVDVCWHKRQPSHDLSWKELGAPHNPLMTLSISRWKELGAPHNPLVTLSISHWKELGAPHNPLMTLSTSRWEELGAPHSPKGIRENSKEPMPGRTWQEPLLLGSTRSCQ